MKNILLFGAMLLSSVCTLAQVEVANGPNLENDRDSKMNRMLGGDENSFYCYRIRSKGKGTSYIVEKYNKATLKPEFSKELAIEENRLTKIEDVEYAGNSVVVFARSYDKDADKMSLFFETVSSTGAVSNNKTEIVNVNTDHYEFVDFEIYPNPAKSKFLVKVFHKANKEDSYKTDFMLINSSDMKKIWSKRVDSKVGAKGSAPVFSFWGTGGSDDDIGFIGLHLDDQDNIFYASSYFATNSTNKEKRYKASVSIIEAKSQEPKTTELAFDEDYLVKDVEFSKTSTGEIVVGGFLKDVIERKGRDLVKVGIFSFTINVGNGSIVSKTVKMFDDKLLTALESNPRKSKYFKYKLDYIIPIGKDVYYIGEQFQEELVTTYNSSTRSTSSRWVYEYMDVIVAKLNAKGEFEWIKNTPLRNNLSLGSSSGGGFGFSSTPQRHIFKQYIAVATDKTIYIINNEHEKNIKIYDKPDFEPKDLKSMSGIHGSNFVYNSINIADGSQKHGLIFNNEDYCFAPIQERNPQFYPPEDTEIFVNGKGDELYIYTEDKGKDRFSKISLK
ncbi:MAG: hypothetical protein K0S44_2635 [Bacteroidetes bacterium]|jgi:hypothetical protein|nr:hypothetical protein [Bacteroidota bacterium]